MCLTVGEHAVPALVSALERDEQHSAVAKFIQNELDLSPEKEAFLTSKVLNSSNC